jgi:hypothetical protein
MPRTAGSAVRRTERSRHVLAKPEPHFTHILLPDWLQNGTVREEVEMKDGSGLRIAMGVVLVVGLIAAAAALGWISYHAGLTQGTAQAAAAPAVVAPYGVYGPHLMAPFGFGFLGCLVPLAFLFLAFSLFRLVACGGMGMHMHGGWGPGRGFMPEGMREHWRQRMEEWHSEAHAPASGEPPTKN